MVYSTSRCPSCGQVIRKQTNPVHEIGIPFERCRYCGTTYKNSYKEEWITKSPIRRFFFFIQSGVWARAFMLPMLLVMFPVAAFDLDIEAVWILWPILSFAWLVGGYFIHKKAEQEDIDASIERTKDAKYLNLLKQAGYTIYPIDSQTLSTSVKPEEPQKPVYGTYNVRGSDIALEQKEPVPAAPVQGQCAPTVKSNTGKRFCSRCGEAIAPLTKKCSGCGKQYFRGIPWKPILIIALSLLCAASLTVNAVLYTAYYDRYDDGYDSGYDDGLDYGNTKGYDDGYRDGRRTVLDEIGEEHEFFHDYAVIVTETGDKYHRYGCQHVYGREAYIYNTELAEAKGYTACLDCYKEDAENSKESYVETVTEAYSVGVRTITLSDKFTADYLYAKWQGGEASEESLEELGGQLYVIEPGQFVEEIDAWCFDPARQVGDIAIIENPYGYSICYISSIDK